MTGPRQNRVALEAAQWVVKFDGVDFDARDVRAFRRWLAKSDAHRTAFEAASRAWNQLDLLARLEAFPLPTGGEEAPASADRRALIAGLGLGALAIGVGGYAAFGSSSAEAFETGVGEQRLIALSDGSRVLLNAHSRLEARIEANKRQARLTAGEALFTIAESNAGPFSIATPSGEIEAASGEILVKLLAEGARVALLSAGGRISRRNWVGRGAPVTANAMSEIVLGREEVAVAASDTQALLRLTSWREGWLTFDNTPLSEAATDVTRQNGVRFVFADPALADLRVGGVVRAGDLEAFLALLETNLAINAERRGDEIILSSTATFEPPG